MEKFDFWNFWINNKYFERGSPPQITAHHMKVSLAKLYPWILSERYPMSVVVELSTHGQRSYSITTISEC
jgi:hypothetical protein